MKKKPLFALCLLLCLCFCLPARIFVAKADSGPKPAVYINFVNLGDELCYATLLSKHPSTGPQSVWDGNEEHIYTNLPLDIWQAFVDYEDADGYYFLQTGSQVNESKEYAWIYYPPTPFKILLYYPERDAFVVSNVCERYAFDTYYTVNMEGVTIGSAEYDETQSNNDRMTATPSYDYAREIWGLLGRLLLTLVVELAVALLFGFRKRKEFLFLCGVNAFTQILLNVLLNAINFYNGPATYLACYFLFELLVFAIEAIVYALVMKKVFHSERKTRTFVFYALSANTLSFLTGLALFEIIPILF